MITIDGKQIKLQIWDTVRSFFLFEFTDADMSLTLFIHKSLFSAVLIFILTNCIMLLECI